MRNAMVDVNNQTHLNVRGRINLGSFYTPKKYVDIVAEWLKKYGLGKNVTIMDSSCGYGAFFELKESLPDCRYIGNDIDGEAVRCASNVFSGVEFHTENALLNISRSVFGVSDDETLIEVGNPPYNDTTSQINSGLKKKAVDIDDDVRKNDLGISFLLSYDKLKADYVAVLHPLSYMIKRKNFSSAYRFFGNYQMLEHLVFSSQEFSGTSKMSGFPVLVALYKRAPGNGITYDEVVGTEFRTVEGAKFSMSSRDYVADFVDKYPTKKRYSKEILFYTLRDINALKRCRTFIKDRCANAVDVDPDKLPYYCYLDCFKRMADVPYWMGNFDVPFVRSSFDAIKDAVVEIALFHNSEVFGNARAKPSDEAVRKVRSYILKAISFS